MVKKGRRLGILLLLLAVLAGCGKAAFSGKSADPEKWAKAVLSGTKFTDQMTKSGTEAALKRYMVPAPDVDSCAVYVGTGATAEELSVWKAKSEKAAEAILKNAKKLVQSQKESYASYGPEEVPKLESAVAEQRDTVVVLCVSADNAKAKQVIDGLFSGR